MYHVVVVVDDGHGMYSQSCRVYKVIEVGVELLQCSLPEEIQSQSVSQLLGDERSRPNFMRHNERSTSLVVLEKLQNYGLGEF